VGSPAILGLQPLRSSFLDHLRRGSRREASHTAARHSGRYHSRADGPSTGCGSSLWPGRGNSSGSGHKNTAETGDDRVIFRASATNVLPGGAVPYKLLPPEDDDEDLDDEDLDDDDEDDEDDEDEEEEEGWQVA
jgi:hypothetical protein